MHAHSTPRYNPHAPFEFARCVKEISHFDSFFQSSPSPSLQHTVSLPSIFLSFRSVLSTLQHHCGNQIILIADVTTSPSPSPSSLWHSLFSSSSGQERGYALSCPDHVMWNLLITSLVFFVDVAISRGIRSLTVSLSHTQSHSLFPLSPSSYLRLRMQTPKLSPSSSQTSLKELLLRRNEESMRGKGDVENNLLFLLRFLTIQKSMEVIGGTMRWTFGQNNSSSPSTSQSHVDLSAFGNEWDDFLLDFPVEQYSLPSYNVPQNIIHKQFDISKEVSESVGTQKYLSEKYLSRVRTVSSLQGKDEEVFKIHKYHSVTPSHRGNLLVHFDSISFLTLCHD